MTNTEFYINGALCDIGPDFGVRLNRQLINPGELNTKDAQYSYSISLPDTARNNANFGYAIVEETRNKFNRVYTAELVVNSVRIFKGNFRLSEINRGYKGNLYIPVAKSVKDIFGNMALNAIAEWRIPFLDFAEYVNLYNQAAEDEPQAAIFPYVLYGLLPKVPIDKNANNYSGRTVWDDSVRFGIQDIPPAINPLLLLNHIFNSKGYQLTGSAFSDERLKRLYMSYKNAAEYVQPWNYGYHATIRLAGSWASTYNKRTGAFQFERGVNQSSDNTGAIYSADLLDATNVSLNVLEDRGGNVLLKTINDASDNTPWIQGQIRVPMSGYYRVKFGANIRVYDNSNWRSTDPNTGVQHICGKTENAENRFIDNIYEVKLLRDKKQADFNLSGAKLDGTFYYDNQAQNETYNGDNVPKYLPQVSANGQINFIDLAQNANMLLGFQFGKNGDGGGGSPYINPKDTNQTLAQILAAKPALSWDTSNNDGTPTRLAINSPGYWKYGRIGSFDSEGDNPNTNIDYSGGNKVTGKILDANGSLIGPGTGDLEGRTENYYLSASYGFMVWDEDGNWLVTDFIDLRNYSALAFTTDVDFNADVAVVAFYDSNRQFIGATITADAPASYVDEPIDAPAAAVYVRISGLLASGIVVSGTPITSNNIILNRFPLVRWFTYTFTAPSGSGYTGYAYLFNGLYSTTPVAVVPFVNGVAQLDTSFSALSSFAPYVTFYLKTDAFSVDGTLVISREVADGSDIVIDWETTNRYHISLNNAPTTYAKRGQYNGASADANWYAQGSANAVVWLEAGELLTVASVTSEGRYRRNGMHSTYGWVNHEIAFTLDIEPFRVDSDWLKVDYAGRGIAAMNWNDAVNFDVDSINLVGFLSADMKTDDFIDNFCKAFNLKLTQVDASTFNLDVKQSKKTVSAQYINLDGLASVRDKVNTSLGLPSLYKLGFTVDTEEEGYVRTGDDGGGQYATGATEENVVEQKSSFSYNWFKDITKGAVTLPLPVISKNAVWLPTESYPTAMAKRYTDQAYRFFYYDGLLNDLGASFLFNGAELKIAKVSNTLGGLSELSYKNQRYTILDNYFTILINGSSHYTELEGHITPVQYAQLNGSIMAMFNGDQYYIAELGGYDPAGKNKTKIKLIRKI